MRSSLVAAALAPLILLLAATQEARPEPDSTVRNYTFFTQLYDQVRLAAAAPRTRWSEARCTWTFRNSTLPVGNFSYWRYEDGSGRKQDVIVTSCVLSPETHAGEYGARCTLNNGTETETETETETATIEFKADISILPGSSERVSCNDYFYDGSNESNCTGPLSLKISPTKLIRPSDYPVYLVCAINDDSNVNKDSLKVEWFRENLDLSISSNRVENVRYLFLDDGGGRYVLRFSSLTEATVGNYSCVISSDCGKVRRNFQVHLLPSVLDQAETEQIRACADDSVTLQCPTAADFETPLNVVWAKTHTPKPDVWIWKEIPNAPQNLTLSLSEVMFGETNYSCVAYNDWGEWSKQFSVTIDQQYCSSASTLLFQETIGTLTTLSLLVSAAVRLIDAAF